MDMEMKDGAVFIAWFGWLCRQSEEIARLHGFHDTPLNDGEQIALMHSELSEGLEALRKDLKSDHIPEFLGIEEELADVIIRIAHYTKRKNLRTAEAVIAKMQFNESRPYKHGNKKF